MTGVKRLPPVVTYSLARLGLFLVPFLVLLVLHVALMWAVLIAFVLSSLVSIFVLSRQRDRVSTSIVERRDRIQQTMADRTAAEDSWDEAQRGASPDAAGDPPAPAG
jgi:hypothetical protein